MMPITPRLRRRSRCALPALLAVLALSCGHSNSSPSTPASPTPPVSTSPTPPPAYVCPLGKGSTTTECSRATPTQLLDAVNTAIEQVAQKTKGVLDTTVQDPKNSGQYRILDPKAYVDGVIGNLRAAGMCADPDYDFPTTRISVKSSNDFSEDFVIVYHGEYAQRGPGSYKQSCSPAAFPVDPDPSWPPPGSGCGKPYPPEISKFASKVWLPGTQYATLDSTPQVGPDVNYCRSIGYRDNRSYCPVRVEGSPERIPCECWRVGKAQDTKVCGPTWWFYPRGTRVDGKSGQLCKGLDVNGCENNPENQYKLFVAGGGTWTPCAENGICGAVSR